jgi:hypothetical protein
MLRALGDCYSRRKLQFAHFKEVQMSTTTPLDLQSPWSLWKSNWTDNLWTASVVAIMQSGAFLLFLYLFMQEPRRLILMGGASLFVFWIINVVASALNAYLLSHPKCAPITFDPPSTQPVERCYASNEGQDRYGTAER